VQVQATCDDRFPPFAKAVSRLTWVEVVFLNCHRPRFAALRTRPSPPEAFVVRFDVLHLLLGIETLFLLHGLPALPAAGDADLVRLGFVALVARENAWGLALDVDQVGRVQRQPAVVDRVLDRFPQDLRERLLVGVLLLRSAAHEGSVSGQAGRVRGHVGAAAGGEPFGGIPTAAGATQCGLKASTKSATLPVLVSCT